MTRPCADDPEAYDEGVNKYSIGTNILGRKIGYVRVSDDDQTEALQVDSLRAAGCELIYSDHGVSGAVKHRYGLDGVLADLQSGDALVVWKLDRLGRSTLHLLQLMSDLRERGIDFIAVTQGIDTTTAIGRMLYGQLAVFAEFEREQIRERTKAGMEAARRRGTHVGRPPALTEAQVVQAIQDLAMGGTTVTAIAKALGVSPQTLTRAINLHRQSSAQQED
jgi:DNA invertase Pin-like site-specific DNA recombinase